MVTVRTLLAITVSKGWYIEQLDINNAFLHGDLHEDVYMTIPQGYPHPLPPNTVCKLTKSLYGSLISVLIYVGDILITGQDKEFIDSLKAQLHHTFSIKDLGALSYYLAIEFLRNTSGLAMSQRKYTLDLLRLTNVLDSKPCATPLEPNTNLNLTDGTPLHDPKLYRTLVGKLIYLTITRLDISFAAQTLSQGLFFSASTSPELLTYCDSDWVSCSFSRRSVSGYGIFLRISLISWQSKKQGVVSRSFT
ncbi:uncharacterized mitochondrial protein-like protein [Tanacetum coccineum]